MSPVSDLKPAQRLRIIGITAAVTLLLAACANTPPPVAQIAVSKAAISNASGAGGSEFAPHELKTAMEKMEAAERAMKERDYALAEKLAIEAQVDAQLATAMARSAKAKKAADTVQEDSRVLRKEIERKTK